MSKFLAQQNPGGEKSFFIRPVQEGDEEDIYRLLRGDKCPLPKDDPRHPEQEAQRLVIASYAQEPEGRGWLAIAADGKAAGIITTKESFSGGIFVDEDYRRRGIAEGLVGAREDYQRARGDEQAVAHIRADNGPSIHLHQKLGYRFDKASAGDPATKPGDTILVMVKPFSDPASPKVSAPKTSGPAPGSPS
jgi:GNAT superfamily N-acetyltransferase